MEATKPSPAFEIYENGDMCSRAWDATEYNRADAMESGIGVYRGDISGRFSKRDLVRYLRRQHPGCLIVNRYTGRKVK